LPIEVRDDKLRELIVQLEGTFSASGIQNALSQAGDAGLQEARSLVPVASGKLRDSIYADVKSSDTLAIGAKAEYAGYIEYGTSKRGATPFIEPAARLAASVLEDILTEMLLNPTKRGRPTTTGSGTYEPTGNKVGRPSTKGDGNQFDDHLESKRVKGHKRYVSKRKSTRGTWIYEYGDQPRLRTKRIKRFDRNVRGSGSANRGS
jgi:HK97 gp10 family phage protein